MGINTSFSNFCSSWFVTYFTSPTSYSTLNLLLPFGLQMSPFNQPQSWWKKRIVGGGLNKFNWYLVWSKLVATALFETCTQSIFDITCFNFLFPSSIDVHNWRVLNKCFTAVHFFVVTVLFPMDCVEQACFFLAL